MCCRSCVCAKDQGQRVLRGQGVRPGAGLRLEKIALRGPGGRLGATGTVPVLLPVLTLLPVPVLLPVPALLLQPALAALPSF